MDRLNSFVSMPENDNVFRKPGATLRDTIPKSAFGDLSNRVPRGAFRPATPRKAAFTGKPLTFRVPQEKQENCDYLQSFNPKDKEDTSGKETLGKKVTLVDLKGSVNNENSTSTNSELAHPTAFVEVNTNSDEKDNYPEPEQFHTSHKDHFDYYTSLPSPSTVHPSSDGEEDYDFAKELRLRYAYKDGPEFGLRLTPVEEKEMNMFAESVYSEVYFGP